MDVDAVFDWLVDGAPGASTSVEVVGKMGADLRAAGVPIHRMAAFVTTLHPTVLGRAFWWNEGEPVRVGELSEAVRRSDAFQKSPVADVFRTRREARRRLLDGLGPADHEVYRELAASGFTDYLCLPLAFTSGEVHAIAFATREPAGFGDAHVEALRRVVRPLSRLAEILALRRTAANLLDTYVGHGSGERILAGRIRRGDVETLRAIIWFSDLRGFTELAASAAPEAVIATLNELFDCQVPAIEGRGGEVLKFIGDGLLAIFPVGADADLAARAEAALAAADDAFAALARRNEGAARPVRFGVALHVGDVAYGNIGGSNRLDFTAIGAAVNLAARLEGLTGKLDRPLVLSSALAPHVRRPLEELGAFELKGVPGVERVHAPR